MWTSVRITIRTELRAAAQARAEAEGKTLAEVVDELLVAYADGKPKKPRR